MSLARRLALPVLLLGLLAGGVVAGEAEGMLAYQRGEFEAAMRELKPAAAAGSVRAQTTVGFMYATGKGVAQDAVEDMRWLGLAAAKGDAEAHAYGLLDQERLNEWLPETRDVDAYFLGPVGFMKAVKKHLKELGVPETQSRYEFFGPASVLD